MKARPQRRLTGRLSRRGFVDPLRMTVGGKYTIVQTKAQRTAWIEIQLIDDKDQPMVNEPYWIVVPDGSTRKGELDENGFARITDILPGDCVVKFPDIDQSDWDLTAQEGPMAAEKPAGTAWLELELRDDTGKPVAGEPFWVKPAGGEPIEGKLDKNGIARIDNLQPGTCLVKFSNIDAAAWESLTKN